MEKEGLQSAVDFTKLLMALAGGGIALVIQPTFYGDNQFLQILSLGALLFQSICVGSGLIVVSGATIMLAKKDYNLERRWILKPGLCNLFSFVLGFVLLAAIVTIKMVSSFNWF
jgi:hypothetical protein